MLNMADTEKMEIDLKGGTVRGTLHVPDRSNPDEALPAVLICRGVHVHADSAQPFFDDLAGALSANGTAVLLFDHRCADLILEDYDAHTATDDAWDAQTAFNWLRKRPEIDPLRIGVIGYSLGAIAAAALAGQNREIHRLCLLAAAPVHFVVRTMGNTAEGAGQLAAERLPASYVPSLASIDSAKDLSSFEHPILLLHGAADRLVPPEVSLEFLKALSPRQNQVEHVLIARADHVFSNADARETCVTHVARFFGAMAPANAQPLASDRS